MPTYWLDGNDGTATQTPAGNALTQGTAGNAWSRLPALAQFDEVRAAGFFRTRGREWSWNVADFTLRPVTLSNDRHLLPAFVCTSSEPTPTSGWTVVDAPNRVFSTNIGAGLSLNDVTYRYYDTARFLPSFTNGGVVYQSYVPRARLRRVASAAGIPAKSWHYDSGTGVLTVRLSLLAAGGPSSYTFNLVDRVVTVPEIEYCLDVSTRSQVLGQGPRGRVFGGFQIDRHGPRQVQDNWGFQGVNCQDSVFRDFSAKDHAFHNLGCAGNLNNDRAAFQDYSAIGIGSVGAGSAGTNTVHYCGQLDLNDVRNDRYLIVCCPVLDVDGLVFADTQTPANPGVPTATYSHTAGFTNVRRSVYSDGVILLGFTAAATAANSAACLDYSADNTDEANFASDRPSTYPLQIIRPTTVVIPASLIGTPTDTNLMGYDLQLQCSTYIQEPRLDYSFDSTNKHKPNTTGIVSVSQNRGPGFTAWIDGRGRGTMIFNQVGSAGFGQRALLSSLSLRPNSTTYQNWSGGGTALDRPLPNRMRVHNLIIQDQRAADAAQQYVFGTSVDASLEVRNCVIVRQTPQAAADRLFALVVIGMDVTVGGLASLSPGSLDVRDNLWIGFQQSPNNFPAWYCAGNYVGWGAGSSTARNTKADFFRVGSLPQGVQRESTPRTIDTFSGVDFPNIGTHNPVLAGAAVALAPGLLTWPDPVPRRSLPGKSSRNYR